MARRCSACLSALPEGHGSTGQFGAQAHAAFHVDDVAVLGEPIDEGGRQMIVFEKGPPFGKAQVGGDEGGLFLVPLMHQGKEQADLNRLDLNIADLVDQC